MNIHNAVNAPIGLTIRVQSAAGKTDSERVPSMVPSEREMTEKTAVQGV